LGFGAGFHVNSVLGGPSGGQGMPIWQFALKAPSRS